MLLSIFISGWAGSDIYLNMLDNCLVKQPRVASSLAKFDNSLWIMEAPNTPVLKATVVFLSKLSMLGSMSFDLTIVESSKKSGQFVFSFGMMHAQYSSSQIGSKTSNT